MTGTVQVLVGFGTGNSPKQVTVQQALADGFAKTNPGATVEFIRVPSSKEASTKLTLLIEGGTPPDLIMPIGVYGTSAFVDKKVFLDLSELLARDGLSLDGFQKVTADATQIPNYYGTKDRHVLGIPVGVHDHAVAYNRELFAAAGVAPPPSDWNDASWTYEKFAEVATQLTRGESVFGIGHFFRETYFHGFGARYYDPATRTSQLDSPEAVAALQFASDLVNTRKVQPSTTQAAALGAGGGQGNEEQFLWRNKQLAMIDMCSCDLRSPYGTDVPFEFGTAAVPAGPKRRFSFLNLDLAVIPEAARNREAAWAFLKYVAFDGAAEKQLSFDSYGAIPPLTANTGAFAAGIKAELPATDPQVWLDGLPFAGSDNEAWFPAFAEVNDLVGKAFDQIIAGAPAAQVLPGLQQGAQAQIDGWFAKNTLPNG